MIKKLLLTTLFSAAALLLIVGGVNRTLDRLAQVSESAQTGGQRAGATNREEHQNMAIGQWETAVATVTNIRNNGLWLQLSDGTQARARRAAWEYAQEQGFMAQIGDKIILTGYTTTGGFEIVAMHNQENGLEVALRDENGRALWHK